MRSFLHAGVALAAVVLCALGTACQGENKAGEVGEDCYPNATCNAGLTCQAGKCVGGTGQTTGTGGAGTGGSTTGGQSAGPSTTSGTGGASATSGTGAGPAGGPPVIVSLGSNVTSITQGESVTITAIVTDPDGINDVIGGNLTDGGSVVYGAFATSSQEGAYQMVLSWAQIQQVMSIDFAEGATQPRTFVAQFFDQAAHMAQKSITVTLACMGHGACVGVCMNLSANVKNCGSCGTTCATGATCAQSACACPAGDVVCTGVCSNTQTDAKNCGTCGNVCAVGVSCFQGKCGVLGSCTNGINSCDNMCLAAGKTCHDACVGVAGGTNVGGVMSLMTGCTSTLKNNVSCGAPITLTNSAKCCCF